MPESTSDEETTKQEILNTVSTTASIGSVVGVLVGVALSMPPLLGIAAATAGIAAVSKFFASREGVKEVQRRLQRAGFDPGSIDGTLSQQTQDAIRQFQEYRRLPVTGALDEKTRESLFL